MSIPPPTLEEGLALLATFSVESIQEAAEALCLLVATYSALPGPALDPRYMTDEACLELLKDTPELHELLKHAHAEKNYESVRNSIFIRKPPLPPGARELLDSIKPFLAAFIRSKNPIKTWISKPKPTDPAILEHMKSLQLPTLDTYVPLLVLKDLGTFVHDPILSHRVKNLFVRGKKTVLVNTSGSGKTRLLFEGLCCEWGLYFTSAYDASNLGSRDISRVIDALENDRNFSKTLSTHSADFSKKLQYNHHEAHRHFSQALLARLLIFRMFLDIAKEGGMTEEHKTRWLLLQLFTRFGLYFDIFEQLTTEIWRNDDRDTQENISDAIDGIREALGPDLHLFCVLDEGQAAAGGLPAAFDAEVGKHPILLKILDTWESYIPQDLGSFVIAGTEIASHLFEGPKYAGRMRWTSDTGAFDDQSGHEQYLRRFLPPSLLATQPGAEFLRRAWKWMRGRHRNTDTLISDLLAFNFQQPHNVLDVYIRKLCRFEPTEAQQLVQVEHSVTVIAPLYLHELQMHGIDFSRVEYPRFSETQGVLQDLLFHYLAIQRNHPLFDQSQINAVSLGLGRFVDGEMKQIAIDESVVIAGAALWLNRPPGVTQSGPRVSYTPPPETVHNYLTILQRNPPRTANTFAKCLAFYFPRAFASKPKLTDIFTFPNPVPAWAKQTAELVEVHATEDDQMRDSTISGADFVGPLATGANNLDETIAWLEHKHHTPFCIPAASNPDLLFVLKLAKGSFIWVIMKVTPTASDGSDLLEYLEEESLFRVEERDPEYTSHKRAVVLLNASPSGTGTSKSTSPTVLRVVASFEDQITLAKPKAKAAPHASLSMDMFRQLMAVVSPMEVVTRIVTNVLRKTEERPEAGEDRAQKRQDSLPVDGDSDEADQRGRKPNAQDTLVGVRSPSVSSKGKRKESPEAGKADEGEAKAAKTKKAKGKPTIPPSTRKLRSQAGNE
ncbi:hypothetical protein C8R44DRAFT_882037 [Mycena epipterygia]|nr:hypothetical protein C8R44DRAFT_882037 [Mycena epipterygia]